MAFITNNLIVKNKQEDNTNGITINPTPTLVTTNTIMPAFIKSLVFNKAGGFLLVDGMAKSITQEIANYLDLIKTS